MICLVVGSWLGILGIIDECCASTIGIFHNTCQKFIQSTISTNTKATSLFEACPCFRGLLSPCSDLYRTITTC